MKALRVQTHQWVKTIRHDQRACPSCNLLAKCANRHHTYNLVYFKRLIIFYFQDSITRDDPIMFQLFSCVFVSCDLNQNISNGTWDVKWFFVYVAFASHLIIKLGCIVFQYEFNFILPPCRNGSNCIWTQSSLIPHDLEMLAELNPRVVHIHASLTVSYLATPVEMNSHAFERQLNWLHLALNSLLKLIAHGVHIRSLLSGS